MMAHSEGGALDYFWGVLAVARMLQRLSAYPLLLLTDLEELPGGGDLREGLRRLNAFPLPLRKLQAPEYLWATLEHPAWSIAWWKLGAWRLTQFEKLVWLDSDSAITRSLDWLFTRPGMWAQRDDWLCELESKRVSTGVFSFSPNLGDYYAMLDYSNTLKALPHGDQQLISMFFANTSKRINLLSDVDAAFGQCLGKAPTPYRNEDGSAVLGLWSLPAFAHKSGGWQGGEAGKYGNICFAIDMTLQRYVVHGSSMNMCHFHPLGPYWRQHFCQAAELLGLNVNVPEVEAYCEDGCWGTGSSAQLPPGPAAKLCSPVHAVLDGALSDPPTMGWPPLEGPKHHRDAFPASPAWA